MPDTGDWDQALEDMKKTEQNTYNVNQNNDKPNRSGGCRIAAVIVVIVFVCIISVFGMSILSGVLEGTWFVPGDANHFDPIAALEEVQHFAGDDFHFVGMKINYVRSDGTLDLNASYHPSVDYLFAKPAANQENNVPIGAPGYRSGDTIEYEYASVSVNRPFRSIGSSEGNYIDFGMSRNYYTSTAPNTLLDNVSPPNCGIPDLWQIARSYDAPSNAVAVINYSADGYHFTIRDVNVDIEFSEDCLVVQS